MKRIVTLAAASLIAVAGLAATSLAQDTTKPPPGGESGAATGGLSPDTGTTAVIEAKPTLADVTAAIEDSGATASQIGTITAVGEVKVVKINELGGNATDLQTAVSENQEDVTKLRGAVEANPALKAELDKQKVEVSSVVATKIEADGAVTVFVQ
jgi:hypothetical protein